ncbi:hypothetical protein AK830_g1187 [Neonectria ditissima]|uniref:Uncharacterized protein n=1 Tax=Neonectria ditissima TaxID=78410 RepID=A0A0P7BXA8_9HYPO|nr:hypothetical protein AK830_g1187 [Neonectria ditissima]
MMMFQGEELPNWGDNITLNALVAILATLLRASLSLIALEITGQTKWDWVSRTSRPVQDMQVFDDASRGVVGSLKLLRLVVFRMPLTIVAIYATLCSLAVGPFTQQAIQTYRSPLPDSGVAAIVTANRECRKEIVTGGDGLDIKFNLRVAIANALVNPSNNSNVGDLFKGQTGNCTFPTYANKRDSPPEEFISHSRLGICSRCFDGDEVNTTSIGVYGMGYGTSLAIKSNNLTWSQNATTVEMLNRARWATSSFSVLAVSQEDPCKLSESDFQCINQTGFAAASCMIYPCLKYYRGSIDSGVLSEESVRDVPLRPQDPTELLVAAPPWKLPDWEGVQQPCLVNGTVYASHNMTTASASLSPNVRATVFAHTDDWACQNITEAAKYVNITAPLDCIYEPSGISNLALSEYLNTHLDLSCGQTEYSTTCDPWYMATLAHHGNATFATIDFEVNSLAQRLTREIRLRGWGPHQNMPWAVKGDAWRTGVCVRIDWG